MKPILKYRGGKYREIPLFEKYIPKKYSRYIEPFLGGGAVFFYLEPKKAILNDLNHRLMIFYKQIRDDYQIVKEQLSKIQKIYEHNQLQYITKKKQCPTEKIPNANESLYYQMRNFFNYPSKEYLESVVYLFINKTAYSGMIRYNKSGEYNVPFGRYPNFNTELISQKHSDLLNKADLFTRDYRDIFEMSTVNDFMFLDPPYDCVFNDYGNLDMTNGFDEKEHIRLSQEFKKLKCKALMIIGKTELTMNLYHNYICDEYHKNYAVNIRNRFNSANKHIVVKNY